MENGSTDPKEDQEIFDFGFWIFDFKSPTDEPFEDMQVKHCLKIENRKSKIENGLAHIPAAVDVDGLAGELEDAEGGEDGEGN